LKQIYLLITALTAMLVLTGCVQKNAWIPVSGEDAKMVAAPIINTDGKKMGEATFTEATEGVTIHITAEGLTPGLHGTHIHGKGKCTPPDFESAGEHFNPTTKEHGFENPKGFHLGDLPNIEVDKSGKVKIELTTKEFSLDSLLDSDGSSLVIHADPDDYKTDPTGNSGERIACAAINK